MNLATVILQLPGSVNEPVSMGTIIIFWVIVLVCVGVFFYFLKRTDRLIGPKDKADGEDKAKVDASKISTDDVHEEEAAAIALAIHMYQSQLHDMESLTITLQKVSRIYSPWSSKIYTLRQNPRH